MKESTYEWLLEGCHSVSEVARAYSPSEYSTSSTRTFRRNLKRFPLLYSDLLDAEYTDFASILTPIHISIIVRHWGLPGYAREELEKEKEKRG